MLAMTTQATHILPYCFIWPYLALSWYFNITARKVNIKVVGQQYQNDVNDVKNFIDLKEWSQLQNNMILNEIWHALRVTQQYLKNN